MVNTVMVGEAVAGESAATRAELVSLISSVNSSTIDIAYLLYKVKNEGYYQAECPTFKEYIKTLAIKERKAQYLTRIVEVMDTIGFGRDQYESLGIAKLREITSLDPHGIWKNPVDGSETPMKDFILELVKEGPDLTIDEIKKSVRTLKGLVGESDIVWKNIPFTRLALEKTINPALELTRANIGTMSKDDEGVAKEASEASCVEMWAVEYLNNPANNPMDQEFGEGLLEDDSTGSEGEDGQ